MKTPSCLPSPHCNEKIECFQEKGLGFGVKALIVAVRKRQRLHRQPGWGGLSLSPLGTPPWGQGNGGTAWGPAGTPGAASIHPPSFFPPPLCLPHWKSPWPSVGSRQPWGARGSGKNLQVTAEPMLGRLYSTV